METLIIDWLSLLLRWVHVITAIAWIGASFYFVWLDNSLEGPPQWKKSKGVSGDLWAFHGGGIYEVAKYSLAPKKMPDTLHWFKWEAYSTWISGTLLLIIVYYLRSELYLVGSDKWISSPLPAVLASIGFLGIGVAVYEMMLRTLGNRHNRLMIAGTTLLIAFSCWLATKLFSDRAAFLHVGALMASIMAANVFLGIIPIQQNFIKAIEANNEPDRASMLIAKMRSVHNNYFTLPVIFCMISNHYAFVYGHEYNALVLFSIIVITAYARHFFNLKHRGIFKPRILLTASTAFLVMIGLMVWQDQWASNAVPAAPLNASLPVDQLMAITQTHCTVCHAQSPSHAGFSAPPAGMAFETRAQVSFAREQIIAAVSSDYMPLANITGMSDQERRTFLQLLRQQ